MPLHPHNPSNSRLVSLNSLSRWHTACSIVGVAAAPGLPAAAPLSLAGAGQMNSTHSFRLRSPGCLPGKSKQSTSSLAKVRSPPITEVTFMAL